MMQCSIIPVSYTHLDVYKRQIIEGASEELTEEELEALTKKGKGSSNDDKDATG